MRQEATMNEWLRIMTDYADKLPYPKNFRKYVKNEAKAIYEKILNDGYLMTSPYYVMSKNIKIEDGDM